MDYNLQYINEWRTQHEIVDWKAIAISLSYENKMLKSYLKDLQMEMIDREMLKKSSHSYNFSTGVETMEMEECSASNDHLISENVKCKVIRNDAVSVTKAKYSSENSKLSKRKSEKIENVSDEEEKPEGFCPINRSKILEKMYGSAATQIAGFETALQLNYEHLCTKLNAKHWPELQLNLG